MSTKTIFIPSTANRLWARMIDAVVIWIFLVPAFGWSYGFFFIPGEVVSIPWALFIYLAVVPIAYEALSIWIFGQTAGKWVFSLHVVSASDDRRPVTGWESLLRAVAGRFTLIFSQAVYAFMFFRYDRTHLADWIAGSRVITSRARPDRSRVRPFLAGLSILLFGVVGWAMASAFAQNLDWNGQGVTFSWPEAPSFRSF